MNCRPGQRRKTRLLESRKPTGGRGRAARPRKAAHPAGRCLADQAVKLELTDSISRETVRRVLKKTNSSRGGQEGVVHLRGKVSAEFVACMADVLDLYSGTFLS